jgi:hypothetical protein
VEVKLQLRVGDVEFWKGELDNKLAQLKEEIEEVSIVNLILLSFVMDLIAAMLALLVWIGDKVWLNDM